MKFAPTLNYLFSVVYILHLLTHIADKQPGQQQNFFTEEWMSSKITHGSILNYTVCTTENKTVFKFSVFVPCINVIIGLLIKEYPNTNKQNWQTHMKIKLVLNS